MQVAPDQFPEQSTSGACASGCFRPKRTSVNEARPQKAWFAPTGTTRLAVEKALRVVGFDTEQ